MPIIRSVKSADSRIINSHTRIPSRGVRSPNGPVHPKRSGQKVVSLCTDDDILIENIFYIFQARWSEMMFLLSWVMLTCDEARSRGSFRALVTFHASFNQPVMWHVRRPAGVDRYPSKRVSYWTLTAYPVVWSFSIYTPNNLSVSGKYGP